MGHLSYVFKMLVLTLVVLMLMQLHVGRKTLENHAEEFIRKSSLLEPARDVAKSGFTIFKNAYHTGLRAADTFVTREFKSENSPGRRKIVELKRSLNFHEQRMKMLNHTEKEQSDAQRDIESEDISEE